MHEIDVHVLHLPGENQEWADQCARSLVDEPINVFNLDGIYGDIRQARYEGYKQGTAPYVSFVDPDDFVHPGAFQVCLDAIKGTEYGGVYTTSYVDNEDGTKCLIHPYRQWTPRLQYSNFCEIHQLAVMRRDLVLQIFEQFYNEMPLVVYHEAYTYMQLSMISNWKAVDFNGYTWRKRKTGCHATFPTCFSKYLTKIRREFVEFHQIR